MKKKDKKILDELGNSGMRTEELNERLTIRETMHLIIDGEGSDDEKRAGFLYFLCAEDSPRFEMMVQLLETMSIFDNSLKKKNDDDSIINDNIVNE